MKNCKPHTEKNFIDGKEDGGTEKAEVTAAVPGEEKKGS